MDTWRDLRVLLGVFALLLYFVFAVGASVFSIVAWVKIPGVATSTNIRLAAFTVVADVVFTAGVIFAVRSLRAKSPRLSWRFLGWTGLAFLVGFALLIVNAATTTNG